MARKSTNVTVQPAKKVKSAALQPTNDDVNTESNIEIVSPIMATESDPNSLDTLLASYPELADVPWRDWQPPVVMRGILQSARVEAEANPNAVTTTETDTMSGPARLVLKVDGQRIGTLDTWGSRALGLHVGFPTDFLSKLDPDLQAQVINARIGSADQREEFQFMAENDRLKTITPGWREFMAHSRVADTLYAAMREKYETVEVGEYHLNGQMELLLKTPREDQITPAVGDVLRHGIRITHSYGMKLEVEHYSERLFCANGAFHQIVSASWSSKAMGPAETQVMAIRAGFLDLFNKFDDTVSHSRTMAETVIGGDPRQALNERAHAMRIPRRHWNDIWEAFQVEPGNTEWNMFNALTRFATHAESVDRKTRKQVQRAAGTWADNFDMVTARLPRPIAMRAGAEIIPEVAAV